MKIPSSDTAFCDEEVMPDASPIRVEQSLFLTADEAGGTVFTVNTCYPDPHDLRLYQTVTVLDASDTMGRVLERRSPDNGTTWGEPDCIYEPVRADGGYWRRGESTLVTDSAHGTVLDLYNYALYPEGDFSGAVRQLTRLFYRISADGGETFSSPRQVIERGYDADDWCEGVRFGENGFPISFSHAFVDSAGRLILPGQKSPKDMYARNEGIFLVSLRAGCLIGTWNGVDYDWCSGGFAQIDPALSSRGVGEPTIVELSDGRFLMAMRGSNYRMESKPARRWLALSTDGGESWSTPEPLAYDDGEPCYSPATGSAFVRSIRNGRLYWIGNLTPKNPSGNLPRYPLVIAEMDEDRLRLKRRSVTVIDDFRQTDSPEVQLSNFRCYQDRATGEINLFMARLQESGERSDRFPSYRYRIALDDA